MISIRIIDKQNEKDINIKNQPFSVYGRLCPRYDGCAWSWEKQLLDEADVADMCFPDENYSFDSMAENSTFIGAYDGDECIGLAIMQKAWFKYMYLYDFKVNAAYRGKGVGKKLLQKAREVAKAQGYKGIYTIGQDNNLGACLFYLNNGFYIGGLDTNCYKHTVQENKKDIYFYYEAE